MCVCVRGQIAAGACFDLGHVHVTLGRWCLLLLPSFLPLVKVVVVVQGSCARSPRPELNDEILAEKEGMVEKRVEFETRS